MPNTKEYYKQYYLDNKDKIKANDKKNYLNNKDRRKELNKKMNLV